MLYNYADRYYNNYYVINMLPINISPNFCKCMLHDSLYTNHCMTFYVISLEEVRDSEHTLSLYGMGRIYCISQCLHVYNNMGSSSELVVIHTCSITVLSVAIHKCIYIPHTYDSVTFNFQQLYLYNYVYITYTCVSAILVQYNT